MEIVVHSVTDIKVRSESDPDVWYDVDGTLPSCTCLGFLHRQGCKHVKEVARELRARGMETKEQQPPPMPKPTPKGEQVKVECPQLYTARYQAQGVLSSGAVVPVCTSLGKPRFPLQYNLEHEVGLIKPDYAFLKKEWSEYVPAYLNKLEKVGPERIAKAFSYISRTRGGKPLALLCYENLDGRKAAFCHRWLFASWWENRTGMQVPELTADGDCCLWHEVPVVRDRREEFLGGPGNQQAML